MDTFTGLSEFLAVADVGTFRAAAAHLRVTPAAVSQAIKALEARLGAPLFLRTTRSVALTEAGRQLYERMRPATREIDDAIEELRAQRGRPAGQLRLSVPRIALDLVIVPVLAGFRRAHPDVRVEIDVNDASVDLAGEGFDAGIRIGRFIERDTVAVRLTEDFDWCVLGSPDYFAARGRPRRPEDLIDHDCIGYRYPTAKSVYRWQFHAGKRVTSVDTADGIIVNDHLTMVALARAGAGLVYTADLVARHELARGELQPVLQAFCRPSRGLYLYFPRRAQTQPKLRAFIDFTVAALGTREAANTDAKRRQPVPRSAARHETTSPSRATRRR
ncbi:MAG: LysR family transcriptional regulator [Hyphomicrobiales bacterium]|nr:MAG: LysR family transcriptional regulator [Hyphomicrobiales bacterium]